MTPSPHILIVDDHREIRELVSRALVKEGLRVSTAGDGKAMRKVLADNRIDLVVLDLMLPGEDGLSLWLAGIADTALLQDSWGSVGRCGMRQRLSRLQPPSDPGQIEEPPRQRRRRHQLVERNSTNSLFSSALRQNCATALRIGTLFGGRRRVQPRGIPSGVEGHHERQVKELRPSDGRGLLDRNDAGAARPPAIAGGHNKLGGIEG